MNRVKYLHGAILRPGRHLLRLSFVVTVCFSSFALGLPTDREQAIEGEADNLVYDQKSGVATYTGNVKITQGSLIISADTIKIHSRPDSSIEKIIATGSPAHFQQQPEQDQSPVTAAASSITYSPDAERLLLVENASLEQDGSVMRGPRIDYDLLKEVMKAVSDTENGKRIQIVIPPRTDQQKQ